MGGIEAARGRYVIMGDADDSYDFLEAPKFVEQLREGYDLVQGCRLPSGGGTVLPGRDAAAAPLVRQSGALVPRALVVPHADARRLLRHARLHASTPTAARPALHGDGVRDRDDHQGQPPSASASPRCRSRCIPTAARRTRRTCARSATAGGRCACSCSSRRAGCSSCPGCCCIVLGAGRATRSRCPGLTIGGATFDVHTLLFASLALLAGQQAISFALFAKTFAIGEGLLPMDPPHRALLRDRDARARPGARRALTMVDRRRRCSRRWRSSGGVSDFGPLDYARTMRLAIPGATLTALGLHTVLGSFFVSILGLRRR